MKALVLALLLIACGAPATPRPAPVAAPTPTMEQRVARYIEVYGGLAGVYRSILDDRDCADLQETLYTATDNHSLGYQVATKDQAAGLGCPELRFTRP